MELDVYLRDAVERVLDSDEVRAVCSMIRSPDQAQAVFVHLVMARTAAGRTNYAAIRLRLGDHMSRRPRSLPRGPRPDPVPVTSTCLPEDGLPFLLTSHSFERFVKRHASEMTAHEAQVILVEEARHARPIREKTAAGDDQWVSQTGILFVVKRDAKTGNLVCATILPALKQEGAPCHRFRRNRHSRRTGT